MFFEKVEFMMLEMEQLLETIEKMKKLNKILVDEVVECRKDKKEKLLKGAEERRLKGAETEFGVVGSDEYRFLIDMVVKNEMEYEARLWSFRKLGQLRGGFEHECFFYIFFMNEIFLNGTFPMHSVN